MNTTPIINTEELKKIIREYSIEGTEKLIEELKNEKWDKPKIDEWFLALTKNMQLCRSTEWPHANVWINWINGKSTVLFMQELKSGIVWLHRELVWDVLVKRYTPEYYAVKAMIQALIEEHLGWEIRSIECTSFLDKSFSETLSD